MSLQRIRLITVVALAFGTGACAGSDPADLIPVGLRASIAAEDKAAQKGPDVKAVSVDDMLAKVRGGKLPPPAPLTAGTPKADPEAGNAAVASSDVGESAAVAQANAMAALPARTAGSGGAPAPAPAPGGVHPLWASFTTPGRVQPSAGGSSTGGPESSEDAAAARPLPPLPIAANTVVMHFDGTGSDLSADERARLDAAVTLHKATSTGARIVAGPAGSGAAFEKLLIAEKRSQAVDQALPESLARTRDYSPRIEADTVRVEFSGGSR